jgi:AraC-like DNA-binding protein
MNYKIYGLFCLVMAYSSIINFLLFSKNLWLFPHLYRTSSPLHYLFGPIIYFFVLYTIEPNKPFKKVYYIHFIPSIVNFYELIPTFSLSTNQKLALIQTITERNFMQFNLGILDVQQHIIIKNILYLIYCFFSFKLLYPFLRKRNMLLISKNKLVFSWLIFETFSKSFLIIMGIFFVVLNDNCIPFLGRQFRNFFYGFEMLISMFYLILNPKLLIGIKWISSSKHAVAEICNRKKKQDEGILQELIDFIELNEAYKGKITIRDVAGSLKISNVKLARIINENYDLSFTDFINNYRLLSVDNQILEKKHLIYSFEYIAYEAGFQSKNAFYVAFKKLRKMTPKKYYNNRSIC